MAGVPPFDSSEVAPEWIGDKDQFTHYSNKIKGYISSWRKAFTKAETNVTEFYNDQSDEMKELAQQSFQDMEVTLTATRWRRTWPEKNRNYRRKPQK